ncbi:MAG TPA: protein translocase subunit SecD [candidate division Zixibacteria bacterium]|nr:protein translocase subunit SecD [candidate division Zixibacteria bacterium]HBZ01071.1 protein translocase subunit SecD [candidate division Zixibacteria bacterium]
MRRGQISWIVVIAVALVVALVLLYPTFTFYSMDRTQQAALKQSDPAQFYSLKARAMRLGLDLQGGVHMVLQVEDPRGGEISTNVQDQVLEKIRLRVDKYGIAEPQIVKSGINQIVVDLPGYTDIDTAKALIGSTAQLQFKLLRSADETQKIVAEIDSVLALSTSALKPSTSNTNKPLAATDAKSDSASKTASNLFGQDSKDTTQLASEDEETAKHPFSTLLEWSGRSYYVTMEDFYKVEKILGSAEVQAIVPTNYQFAWATRPERRGDRQFQQLYVVNKNIEMTGESLVSVREGYDQMRKPEVSFELDADGARRFSSLTGKHVGDPLAIIIDDRVESAPEIQSRISKSGRITMGGNATISDAYLLATLLKAGALPANVEILQSTVIGPALGQDSINKGKTASFIGIILVVIFMAIYYKISGLIADMAVILNTFFILAFMVIPGVNSTLTMPGIAGIILTVGMSVDSNVLIFERIREELRTGKTVRAAIDAGYDRALLTVIDSHVTTLITALFLFIFGSGTIRGFAVTLSVGILLSLFTAIFVTKTVFDLRKQYKSLSI